MRFHRFMVLSLVTLSILLSIESAAASTSETSPTITASSPDPDDRVKIATRHFDKKHSTGNANAHQQQKQHHHGRVVKKKFSSLRDIDIKHFYGGRNQEFAAKVMNLTTSDIRKTSTASVKAIEVDKGSNPTTLTSLAATKAPTSVSLLTSDVATSLVANAEDLTVAIAESASSTVASVVDGADKVINKSLRRLRHSILNSLLDGDEDDDDDGSSPPRPKPKPKPKPVPLPPSNGAAATPAITSSSVIEDKIYSNDLVPYQHFGHYVLSADNFLFVSSAIPSSLKDNKIYVFSLNVSYASTETLSSKDSSSSSNSDGSNSGGSTVVVTEPTDPTQGDPDQGDGSDPSESNSDPNDRRLVKKHVRRMNEEIAATSSPNVTVTRTMLQSLSSDTTSNYDGFGLSMSSDGDWVAVGAPYDDTKGYLSGKVYLYRYHSESGLFESNNAQPYLLSASTFPMGTMYGSTIANSGNFLAIGAPGESISQRLFAGAVHLYQFNANTGTWSLVDVLYDDAEENAANYERFGTSVIMVNDEDSSPADAPTLGVSLIVSAIGKSNGEGNSDTGAVFVYYSSNDESIQSSSANWRLYQTLAPSTLQSRAYFGYSMAFTNEFGAIAAYSEDNSGVVYLYRSQAATSSANSVSSLRPLQVSKSAANRQWVLQQMFYPSDAGQGMDNQFGSSLAIRQSVRYEVDASSSSTNCIRSRHVLVVGAYGDSSLNTDAGAVYLFASDESQECTTSSSVSSSSGNEDGSDLTLSPTSKKTKKAKNTGDWQVIAKFTCEDHQQFNAYGRSVQMMHFTSEVQESTLNEGEEKTSSEPSVSTVETTILFVGAELANSPQANNSGVVYLEQNTLSYLLEEYTEQEQNSGGNGDSSSTFWQRLQAMFSSSAGYVTMAFLPSALFVVCVMFHFHQKHQLAKKKKGFPDSMEMSAIESWGKRNSGKKIEGGNNHELVPTSNTEDETDAVQEEANVPLNIATNSTPEQSIGLFEKLRTTFNFTALTTTGHRRGHVRSTSNVSSLSSASGTHSSYKQVNKSEHGDKESEEIEEQGFSTDIGGDVELGQTEHPSNEESFFPSTAANSQKRSSHKRRGSKSSDIQDGLEIEIPIDYASQEKQEVQQPVNAPSPFQNAAMDEIYPNNEQLLSPVMMQNLLHQHNGDGVPFSDQWVKASSITSPQQVFADYRFTPTVENGTTAGAPNYASSGGDANHHHTTKDTGSDTHSISSSETKNSHGSTLSKVKKLLHKISHPGGSTHKKRHSISSNGSADHVFNPLPLDNVEEAAESETEVYEHRPYQNGGRRRRADDDDDEDHQIKHLQSSLTL